MTVLGGVLAAAQVAQSEESAGPEIDRLKRHVYTLASPEFEGRGTAEGKRKAREHLVAAFRELRLQPLFPQESYLQEIPGPKQIGGQQPPMGINVGAVLPGSDARLRDEYVIVSAHFDHLGIRGGKTFHGADDNAGSVAMMLEVARLLADQPVAPRRSVVFLSCDLEESLLWGSRWFVAHPPWPLERVKLFVTAELIGRTLGDLPLPAVFVMGGEQAPGLRQLVDGVTPPGNLQVSHLGVDLVGVRSDYGPFKGEKVPFLFFSGGEHRDYHQPTDTADRLDYQRLAHITQVIRDVVREVAMTETPPAWSDRPEHTLGEVETIERITGTLLQLDDTLRERGRGRLTDQQRFTVSNIHTKTRTLLSEKQVSPADRAWLIRSAQWMLLTVF
ncbi:MAG: M28 family peptidase [Planctomycetaceae bacterium]|jgi:hypothetical protein